MQRWLIPVLMAIACDRPSGDHPVSADALPSSSNAVQLDEVPVPDTWEGRLEEVRNATLKLPVTRPRPRMLATPPTVPAVAAEPLVEPSETETAPDPSPPPESGEQLIRTQRLEQLPREWRQYVGKIPEGARVYVGEAPPLVTSEAKRETPPSKTSEEEASPPPKPPLPNQPVPQEVEAACGQLCAHLKEEGLKGIYKQCMDTCRNYVLGK